MVSRLFFRPVNCCGKTIFDENALEEQESAEKMTEELPSFIGITAN